MSSRRDALALPGIPGADTNAGLWLDKALPDVEDKGPGRQTHFGQLSTIRVTDDYRRFYRRWRDAVQTLAPCTRTEEAKVLGRMVVGLGAESVLETSIFFQRAYGVPCIPGSSLKGLAAAAAHQLLEDGDWHKTTDGGTIGRFHKILFGDQESSGYVTFHDALWIPEEKDELPLDLDVMTVHHPDYYGGKDNAPAADWDSPNPVAFITAHGLYLLAVTGPQEWAGVAMEILTLALAESGAGAKTAAGYGRMQLAVKAQPPKVDWQLKIKGLRFNDAPQRVPPVLQILSGDERRQAAAAIIEMLGRKEVRKKKDKPWAQQLLEAAEE